MLSTELEKNNCKTYHAPGDADLLIVQKAVQSATTSKTVLVSENTDLIVLLCYHASLDSHDICQRKTQKSFAYGTSEPQRKSLIKTSATTSSSSMLFLSVTLYGIGKGMSLSKFKASSMFREQAKVFHSDSASTHDVIDAGEKALALVYNGMLTETLDSLRHKRFCEKVSQVKPQSLPPTSAAAKYHSLRVYLQV